MDVLSFRWIGLMNIPKVVSVVIMTISSSIFTLLLSPSLPIKSIFSSKSHITWLFNAHSYLKPTLKKIYTSVDKDLMPGI
jgi:hypothetical protein